MKAINESRRLQREIAVDDDENEDGQREKRVLGAFQENKSASGIQEVPFIVKADVIGSVEAVVNLISGLGNSDVRPHIIRSGAGAVTEGDVELAAAANGYILAFNTDVEPSMQGSSVPQDVQILRQSIIYRVAEDVNRVLEDAMPYFVTQRVTGEAEIAQTFSITLPGKVQLLVAGCKVRNGLVTKGSKVKVLRGGEIVHDGLLTSLKNVKKEVSEMKKDTECGMSFNGWDAFEVGDKVQCYSETKQKKSLTGGDHSS